ncbi:hypothetical protein [Aeromonas jandaei]|uniref:hypothetical protein n=1 Tax=Aeromonas jandaei TaxID=650 RepID=UPI001F3811F6|nr:hypothetical protein [Aeromonas jandaei]
MIKSIRRRKYDSMVEPRPCCSFCDQSNPVTGLSFLELRAGLVAKQQTIRLATVKALQQKSSARKWKTGKNDPLRPKLPRNDVFYLKSENKNKMLLLNIILKI